MTSKILKLSVGSRDLSQAEKNLLLLLQVLQVTHKKTTIFTQKNIFFHPGPFK